MQKIKQKSKLFLEEVQDNILIGDGAYGTELILRGARINSGIERLNITNPDLVLKLHREYVDAGCRIIETNTFGANRPNLARFKAEENINDILSAGVRLAREAARPETYIAGSVGPLPHMDGEPLSGDLQAETFREQVGILLDCGIDLIIFETFSDLIEITTGIKTARSLTDIPIIAQMAFERGGRTPDKYSPLEVGEECIEAGADIIGANCGEGVPSVLNAAKRMVSLKKPVSAYMNAGFAEQIEGRRLYIAGAPYLSERALELAHTGVKIIGGCCGTNPSVMKAVSDKISLLKTETLKRFDKIDFVKVGKEEALEKKETEKIITPSGILVELDPPGDLNIQPLVECAGELKEAGIKYITLADNPLASVRVDVLAAAGILKIKTGLSIIPHLTGRDRNRIGLGSIIMGAHIHGIRHILCVTGDPVRMYHETETTGVFDLNSIGLVKLVSEFNSGRRLKERTAFSIGVAVNPNAKSLKGEIKKLKRKVEEGAHFVLTQPVFEAQKLDNLLNRMEDEKINVPVFAGLFPLTSARNAHFLHNEVPGINIPEQIRQKLSSYDKLQDQRKAATEIAVDLAESYSERVKNFYLITPRNRTEFVIPVIRQIKSLV